MSWADVGNFLKNVSEYIGYIAAIIGICAAQSKRVRRRIVDVIKKHSNTEAFVDDIEEIKEAIQEMKQYDERVEQISNDTQVTMQALQRSEITRIYYANLPDKTLPSYEKENLMKLYEVYKLNNGNSYVHDIVENEMRNWNVRI